MTLVHIPPPKSPTAVRLDWLDVSRFEPAAGDTQRKKSVGGHPLIVAGQEFPLGISVYADAEIVFELYQAAQHFTALFGIDDGTPEPGAIECSILVDGKLAAETGRMQSGDAIKPLSVELAGANEMVVRIRNVGKGIPHVDIINGNFIVDPDNPMRPEIAPRYLDPHALDVPKIASGDPPEPAIHGPRVTGTTPGRPFFFLIPATGNGSLAYAAEGLPAGLALDAKTGIISGSIQQAGRYKVAITVCNELGHATRTMTIVAGDRSLARTPPMGWNSWNAFGFVISDEQIRQVANALVSSGLAAKGFQYVCIDDAWEGDRAPDGTIRPNDRFPHMKALGDHIHAKGLRFGIYSSPGPKTCGNYEGSYQHELADARWYASIGVDYLKYDWCSYGSVTKDRSLAAIQKPYRVMREALDQVDRDIVFSFCQYGEGGVWQWGPAVGGNLWRTTSDISDSWTLVRDIVVSQPPISAFSTAGHWNDPDLLVLGRQSWGANMHNSRLTPNEQLAHFTMWVMLSAPLILSCDLTTPLDAFTTDLLTNTEVIDVNQDELGRGADRVKFIGEIEVWKKPLFDGAFAVALFNMGRFGKDARLSLADIGIAGPQRVRDLWQRQDIGSQVTELSIHVPRHGTAMFKVGTPQTQA